MNPEEKKQVEKIIKKQRKMGKILLKAIKKDPPNDGKRSFGSLSDTITLKYMNLFKRRISNQKESFKKMPMNMPNL
jgi:hypothetical protein